MRYAQRDPDFGPTLAVEIIPANSPPKPKAGWNAGTVYSRIGWPKPCGLRVCGFLNCLSSRGQRRELFLYVF